MTGDEFLVRARGLRAWAWSYWWSCRCFWFENSLEYSLLLTLTSKFKIKSNGVLTSKDGREKSLMLRGKYGSETPFARNLL